MSRIAGSMMLIMVALVWTVGADERMAVVVDKANIRSGPGPQHEIIWMVEKYHPLMIVKKVGAWYRFRDFEGDEGWIHKSLLGQIPSVIVKKDDCNVRSGPGTDNDTLFVVEKGIPFKVLERKGRWIEVEHADGDTGWIHDSLVW